MNTDASILVYKYSPERTGFDFSISKIFSLNLYALRFMILEHGSILVHDEQKIKKRDLIAYCSIKFPLLAFLFFFSS